MERRPVLVGIRLRGSLMSAATTATPGLTGCGNCGGSRVRCRVRGGQSSRCSAQVVCSSCGAQSALFVGPRAQQDAADAWARQPYYLPPAAQVHPKRPGSANLERDLQRDPLELVARMLVGGSFRLPTEGRSSRQLLTSADVAGAVGLMRDPVAKQAVLAVARRGEGASLVALGRAAARRMMRQVSHRNRGGETPALRLDDAADRWRMRLVLQDAVNDLVWPEGRVAARDAAKAVKMRKGDYLQVYAIAAATLKQALEDGRQEFKVRLFSRG